jgi:hypothetical protein
MDQAAVISTCGKYRYLLQREVSQRPGAALFILLNPSTADAEKDDPTIRKCMGFARKWGYGRLRVVNLFAYRATSPLAMKVADDPVGEENQYWIDKALRHTHGVVVCAWGNHGGYRGQDVVVMGWLDDHGIEPMALRVSRQGEPYHPLYVPYGTRLFRYAGRRRKPPGRVMLG